MSSTGGRFGVRCFRTWGVGAGSPPRPAHRWSRGPPAPQTLSLLRRGVPPAQTNREAGFSRARRSLMRCGHGCLLPACTLTSVLRARAFTRGCGKYGRPSPVPSPSALRPRDAGLRAGRAQMPIVTPTARRLIASATRSHPRPASQTPVATDLLSFLPLSHFQNVVHKWAAFRPLWLQAQLRSRGCHLRGLWDWLSHSLSLSLCTSVLVVLCVSSLFLPVVAWVWTVHRGSAGSLPKGAGLFPVWGCRAWVCRPAWTEVLVSQGGLTPPPRPAAAQSSCAV